MLGQIDAHGLGGDLIVPDGLERPSVGGVDQQHDQQDAHTGNGGVGHHVLRRGKVVQRVGAVGQRAELAQLHQTADDLRKAQCGDGQIVALQPQHRQADEKREERGHHTGHQQRQHQRHLELHQTVAVVAEHGAPQLHRDGQNGVGVGAQQHKARLTQREQAGKAVQQVQGHRHQRVNGAFFQHRRQHGIVLELIHIQQKHDADGGEDQRQQQISFLIVLHISHLLRQFFAEQAVGLAQQDDDQQRKGERIGEHGPALAERFYNVFANTDYKRADDRTGDRPDAAENSRNEGLQAGHCAGGRNNGRVVREIKQRSDGREKTADNKGKGYDRIDF